MMVLQGEQLCKHTFVAGQQMTADQTQTRQQATGAERRQVAASNACTACMHLLPGCTRQHDTEVTLDTSNNSACQQQVKTRTLMTSVWHCAWCSTGMADSATPVLTDFPSLVRTPTVTSAAATGEVAARSVTATMAVSGSWRSRQSKATAVKQVSLGLARGGTVSDLKCAYSCSR